jgi:hypothetical protein
MNSMTLEAKCGDFIMEVGRDDAAAAPLNAGTAFDIPTLCRITTSPGSIEITTDSGGLYAIFGDRETGVISSSLQAVCSQGRKYPVNTAALCEQLITGAVAGRETCFQGIERMDGIGPITIGKTQVTFRRFDMGVPAPPRKFRDARSCADFQLEVLRAYFQKIGQLSGARGVSLGLSGGYDSRLMLLLAKEAKIPVHPFTFASPDHTKEFEIATRLAELTGVPLRKVAVRSWTDLDAPALAANMDDALAYYDGRTNETMGTFGDCHTARIQRECRGEAAINLNGLGGELYRNRERLPPYGFGFMDWLAHYVIKPDADKCFLSAQAYKSFLDQLSRKYSGVLNSGALKRFDRHMARRWYHEVWLPCFAGPRLSAENRVGLALMPFADGAVSAAAFAATPFIGAHGEFEASLIRRIDEKIASMPSTYGPGFAPSSTSRRLRDLALALVPLAVRRARHRLRTHPCSSLNNSIRWRNRFGESLQFLKTMPLPLNLDFLLHDQVRRDRVLYVSEFLYRQRAHIAADN